MKSLLSSTGFRERPGVILGLILLFFISTLSAQGKGTLSGKIVDNEFGEGLIGANVLIIGTSIGAATDFEGKYEIKGIPEGIYSIRFSSVGFAKKTVTNVEIKDNQVTKIDITLSTEAFETQEVVVTAKAATNTEASLLVKRQKAMAVSDAISAEAIAKSGSGDAASAMKKVTGASVVGGKYVYVRGLGERYSATTLNGAELPSADPDKKSFQLDLFPSSLLENINTVKTFTPDKPGTFTGGLVDVTMKSFPEKFYVSFSASSSMNSQVTGSDEFILPNQGGTDWLGMDDGTRELPELLRNPDVVIPSYTSVKNMEEAKYLDKISKSFNNVMAPKSASAPVNQGMSFAVGNNLQIGEGTVGYFGSLTWNQNYSFYNNGELGRWNLVGPLQEVEGLDKQSLFNDTKGTREVNWGAVVNVAYKHNSVGQLKASYIRTQSGESSARYISGFWKDIADENDKNPAVYETRVLSWKERALNTFQFEGEHRLGFLFDSKFDWKASFSNNEQDEPDQRYFSNHYAWNERDQKFIYQSPASLYSRPIRYFRNLEETNNNYQVNLQVPFAQWSGLSSRLKIGGAYSKIDRNYNQRRFEYIQDEVSYKDFNGNEEAYFNAVGLLDPNGSYRSFGQVISESKSLKNNFTGMQETSAAYLMVDLPVSRDLRVIGGVRMEKTLMEGISGDPDQPNGKIDNTDWLPSLNLVYQLSENMNFRVAYSNTIARPTFRELAPYTSFEFIGDFLFEGNANLKRTLIKNYDVRYEWFMNPGEIFAVSGFYKDFADPIEKFIDSRVANGIISVQNVEKANIYGLEFELRKSLSKYGSWLRGISLGTNFTYVKSEVDIPQTELDYIKVSDPDASSKREFQGQSPYLFNINLNYENNDAALFAGIYYNIFGDRLSIVTMGANPDVYERGYGSLDLKVSKEFIDLFKISLSAKNLLNPEIKHTQELNGKEFVYQSYKKGISFGVSLSVKL